MLLKCPSCSTRYVVPDDAIGITGRQVRCASCKHSWFQEGVTPDVAPAPDVAAPRATEAPQAENRAEAAAAQGGEGQQTNSSPSADQRSFVGFEEAVRRAGDADAGVDEPAPPPPFADTAAQTPPVAAPAPEHSQFAHEPPFKPRRNPAKLWTMAAVAFALVIALTGGALWYFGVPQASFAANAQEPDLTIVLHPNDLSERPDGTPYYIASGTIVNPTGSAQKVPDIQITLKDAGGRPVYSWKMKPKQRSIAPGGKLDFSEARLDVPLAAAQISASWVLDKD